MKLKKRPFNEFRQLKWQSRGPFVEPFGKAPNGDPCSPFLQCSELSRDISAIKIIEVPNFQALIASVKLS